MTKWIRETNFGWNNWTFGFWYLDNKSKTWGIDLGPLNFTWKPERRKSNLGKVIKFPNKSTITKDTGQGSYHSGPVRYQDISSRPVDLRAYKDGQRRQIRDER